MAYVQEFFTSRGNYQDGNTRLGQKDRLWYDSESNTIRVGDGTPGGKVVSGGGGAAITVADEGTVLTTAATSLNFVGNAVTATNSGGSITVQIADTFLAFDGGSPDSDYTGSPSFDAGGVV